MYYTPPKINMEPKNGGLVQMFFLFQGGIFRFKMLVFGGVMYKKQSTPPKTNMEPENDGF